MPFVYYFIWDAQHGPKRTEACCRWGVEDALIKTKYVYSHNVLSINMYVSVNVSGIIYA